MYTLKKKFQNAYHFSPDLGPQRKHGGRFQPMATVSRWLPHHFHVDTTKLCEHPHPVWGVGGGDIIKKTKKNNSSIVCTISIVKASTTQTRAFTDCDE